MARFFWKDDDQAPWLKTAGQRLEASLLRAFLWRAARLAPRQASAYGRRLFSRLGPRTAKQRHVLANLGMVCPEAGEAERRALAGAAWGNLGAMIAELPHLDHLIAEMEVVCENRDPDFLAARRPCIFIAAHLGNIYLSAAAIRSLGYDSSLVYSPLANPFLDRLVQARLAVLQCDFITKQDALRPMLQSLKQGRSVGIHVDVRVDGGEMIPLLGTEAPTTTAPAWLALRTGCPIVPVRSERREDGGHRVTLYPALEPPPSGLGRREAVNFLTRRMNEVVGALIREHPDQWMCTKRRWPKAVMRARGLY
ncbi:MAG TPA: hypothetical protein ENK48_00740 [Gammaproteobacteria bacterium]|nr:hypothetical protein [Gammaproteobacteria bacterium]